MTNTKYLQLVKETNWTSIQISDLLLGWSAPRLEFLKEINDNGLISNKAFMEYPYQVTKYYLKVVNHLATRLKFKTPRVYNNEVVHLLANDFTIISNDLNKNLLFSALVNDNENWINTYSDLKSSWSKRLDTDAKLINEVLKTKDLGEWVDDDDNLMVIKKVVSDSEILTYQPEMDLSCIKIDQNGLIDYINTNLLAVDNLAFDMVKYQKEWWDLLSGINNFEILINANTNPEVNENNFLMYICSVCEMYGLYYWAISMYKKFATALTINISLAKSNEQNDLQFDKLATKFDIDQEALITLPVKYTSEFYYLQMKSMADLIKKLKPYLDI